MAYFQKESAELVSLSSCELIESQFGLQSEYAMSVVLDYFTEVTEQVLPAHEPNEKFYRLLASVLAYLRLGHSRRRCARSKQSLDRRQLFQRVDRAAAGFVAGGARERGDRRNCSRNV